MSIEAAEIFTNFIKNPLFKNKSLGGGNNSFIRRQADESSYADRIKELKEAIESDNLKRIQTMMKFGIKLSDKEMEYLKENAPWLYDKAKRIEKEREEFKRELEQCKTKKEVERVWSTKISLCLQEARAVESCPGLSEEEKEDKLEFIGMRMAAIDQEHSEFIKTPQYHMLPDDDQEANRKRGTKTTMSQAELPQQRKVSDYAKGLDDKTEFLSVSV